MPAVVYKVIYGQSLAGVFGYGDFTENVATPLAGESVSGLQGEGLWYDAALQLYGNSLLGLENEGAVDVNEEGQIYEVPAYGESLCGSLISGILFLDPDEERLRAYFFESQYQAGGSDSESGLRSGATESEAQ